MSLELIEDSADLVLDESVIEILAEVEQGEPGPAGVSNEPGPKGDKGDKGDQGDKGDTGAPGIAQSLAIPVPLPGLIWTINHNTNSYPGVTTLDTQGQVMYGDVSYPSANQVRIEFLAAFAGTVVLT